jgi:hypothetical protein
MPSAPDIFGKHIPASFVSLVGVVVDVEEEEEDDR